MQLLKPLAAKVVVAAAVSFSSTATFSGIPVYDGANNVQTIISASESVTQTLTQAQQYAQQIQQYQLQLQQYENMIKNTAAPAYYTWNKAQETMNALRNTVNTVSTIKNTVGSLDGFLSKFQNVDYYRSSPCFQKGGCTAAEWAVVKNAQTQGSAASKSSNDALLRAVDQQQDAILADSRTLEQLQSQAQGADGQMRALQSASMIAANTGAQLLQIRGLLAAQQTSLAIRQAAQMADEAIKKANTEKFTGGRYLVQEPKKW